MGEGKKTGNPTKVVDIVRKMEEEKETTPKMKIRVPQGWKVEGAGNKRRREEEIGQHEDSSGKKQKFRIFEKRYWKTTTLTNIGLGNKCRGSTQPRKKTGTR